MAYRQCSCKKIYILYFIKTFQSEKRSYEASAEIATTPPPFVFAGSVAKGIQVVPFFKVVKKTHTN
jgi:hypothetical protein